MRGFAPWPRSIRKTPGAVIETVVIGPERYNELYEKFGNLNSLLGWGHARVIENLLAEEAEIARGRLSDKFADARVIERSLLQRGQSDPAGAADEGGVGSGRGGGFDPGARSVHRLAG